MVSIIHLGDIKIILASTGKWQKMWNSNLYNISEINPLNVQILGVLGLSSYLIEMLPIESIEHLSILFLPNK